MSKNNKKPNRQGGPMGNVGRPVEKAKDFKGTFRKLISYMSPYKIQLFFVLLFAIGSTIFSIVGPKILGNVTTEIFEGVIRTFSGKDGIDFDKIGKIITILVALYLTSALFGYIQGFIMTGVAQKVTYNLRKEFAIKIGKLPLSYYDTKTHGEVLSRITNDVDTLSQSLNQSLTQIITSIVTVIGIFIMMLTINIPLTFVAILTLPLSMFAILPIIKKSQKYFIGQQKYLGTVNGAVEETYSGQNIVKVFNREEETLKTFNEENDKLYKSSWKAQFLSGLLFPLINFIGNFGYVLVSVFGGYLAIKGKITIGDIQSFIQYTRNFTQPIGQMAQISSQLQSTIAASERIFEFLEEKEETENVENPVSTKDIKARVEFENVKFGYNSEKIIINDFSSDVEEGKKIAIVGPTGAGKTTIIKLLMRFYDVNSGKIKIDGHDIKDFDRGEVREIFGMVLQDTWLFTGTIKENIRYGRPDATDEEVYEAAKAAHVHHFIETLPDGYDMIINEEASNISQGEKQLLTIARAILANPKILILDEATSSVDTRTEQLIQKAMDALMQNRTSFVIAHRLSTIKNADKILVMKDGDIIEQGNHEELIDANGFYAALYNSQFEKTAV